MSVDILGGAAEFPGNWGPSSDIVEFVITDATRPESPVDKVTLSQLGRTIDIGGAALFLYPSSRN